MVMRIIVCLGILIRPYCRMVPLVVTLTVYLVAQVSAAPQMFIWNCQDCPYGTKVARAGTYFDYYHQLTKSANFATVGVECSECTNVTLNSSLRNTFNRERVKRRRKNLENWQKRPKIHQHFWRIYAKSG